MEQVDSPLCRRCGAEEEPQLEFCVSVKPWRYPDSRGHYTLRRHLYIMEQFDSPLCKGCGAEEATSARGLCDCEALEIPRLTNLGSFFLDHGH